MVSGIAWYTDRPEFKSKIHELRRYLNEIESDHHASETYVNRRGAMVVDVVTSRQRQYSTRVLKIVRDWAERNPNQTLEDLVKQPLDQKTFGLRNGETESITLVAKGLLAFGEDFNIEGEDLIVESWAKAVEDFRFAPKLDPYVGYVDGLGIALFAYLRKLSGADAIKPDVRVRKRLQNIGFEVPDGSQALMMLCEILAEELKISKSKFDDLLWREPVA